MKWNPFERSFERNKFDVVVRENPYCGLIHKDLGEKTKCLSNAGCTVKTQTIFKDE